MHSVYKTPVVAVWFSVICQVCVGGAWGAGAGFSTCPEHGRAAARAPHGARRAAWPLRRCPSTHPQPLPSTPHPFTCNIPADHRRPARAVQLHRLCRHHIHRRDRAVHQVCVGGAWLAGWRCPASSPAAATHQLGRLRAVQAAPATLCASTCTQTCTTTHNMKDTQHNNTHTYTHNATPPTPTPAATWCRSCCA